MEEDDDDLIRRVIPPSEKQFLDINLQPLPPAHLLEAYEQIVPGSAQRILDRMERESDHRHWIDRKKLEADIKAQARGQWFGLIVTLIVVAGGFGLIWIGKSAIGISVFIATLASLTTIFIYGKRKQEKFLEKQLKQFKELAQELRRRPLPEAEELPVPEE